MLSSRRRRPAAGYVRYRRSGATRRSRWFERLEDRTLLAIAALEPLHLAVSSLPDVQKAIVAGDPDGTPPDSPANREDANTTTSPFAGVGSLSIKLGSSTFICTGTAVGPIHVLTAAHCLDLDDDGTIDVTAANVKFNLNFGSDLSHIITASNLFVHPDWTGFLNPSVNDDVAVVELSSALPDGVPVYALHTDPFATGETITAVGYGRSGDGVNGYTTGASFTIKRVGGNLADFFDLDDEGSGAREIFEFDFDGADSSTDFSGTSGLGNDVETTLGGGDSGGPSFVDDGAGGLQVFGINTYTFGFLASTPLFGSGGGGMAVTSYASFINSIIHPQGVTVTQSGGSTDVAEGGATDTYTVVLNTQPAADVTISINPGDQLSVSATELNFTASNWDTPQTVTVTAIDDSTEEGPHTGTITHTAASSDPDYDGISIADVTANITDNDVELNPRTGVVSGVTNTSWTTVTLDRSYISMVVVLAPNYSSSSIPLVPRVRNASGNGFELQVDRTDGSTAAVSSIDVHYLVVEEGVYTVADHGVNMEAVKFTSTVTDRSGSWNGEARSYANSYTNPVVVGQVMTDNDADFSVFWSRGGSQFDPPSSSVLRVGKHVGEDSDTTRSNETIGYIVIESGSGSMDNLNYVAAVGADTIQGVDDGPPFSYSLSGLSSVSAAVVSQAAMDGGNGSWAMLYGANPVTTSSLNLAVDEDQAKDAERIHTTEQVAYIVLEVAAPASPGVTIVESSGSTDVTEDGATDTYTVVLDTQPAADVTISIDAGSQLSVSSTELTFTTSNWDTPQTVTITALDDSAVEGAHTGTITHTAASGDPDYDGVSIADVTANITDNDIAGPELRTGVVSAVTNTDWTTVTLDRSYASMVVVLTPNYSSSSIPLVPRVRNATLSSFELQVDRTDGSAAAVAGIDVHYLVMEEGVYTVADHGVNMEAVKFTSTVTDRVGSWNAEARSYANTYTNPVVVGQVMTDNDPDFSVFWSRGGSQSEPPSSSVLRVGKHVGEDPDTTRANETIGYIVIESGSGSIGGLNYVAALGANTIRGMDNGPPFSYSLSGLSSVSAAVVSQAAMDGNNGSWGVLYGADPVTTSSLNLAVDEDQAKDSERSHLGEQVAYIVLEVAAVTPGVTIAESGGSTDVTEGGTTDSYTMVLNTQPAADVTITINAGSQLSVSSAELTFTTSNWDTPQTVTVSALDDSDVEGAHTGTITHTAASGDADYDGITIADVTANITDNDVPGVTIVESSGSTDVAEGGATDTYTVVLDTQPAADVTITINAGSQLSVSSAELTFTTSNWDTPQTVTVSALDDSDVEGTHTGTITHTAAGGDPDYDAISIAAVTANITDNDIAGPELRTDVVSGVTNTAWSTVTLDRSYTSMVVVLTPNYSSASVSLVPRVRNASGSSFELQVSRTDGSTAAVAGIDVHYLVMEEGVYTVADHGVNMEAVKFTSTVTDRVGSWNAEARSYANSYTNPVVVGQVMTDNDPDFSVFWSRGGSQSDPPSSSVLRVGKHVGEDLDTTRANETIGYIVIESGSGSIGSLNYVAAVGADTIQGVDNGPPFSYSLSGLSSVSAAVVSQAAMDGGNGSWAVLYGANPVSTSSLNLAVDEDQAKDAERIHTTEQVAYLVFGSNGSASLVRRAAPGSVAGSIHREKLRHVESRAEMPIGLARANAEAGVLAASTHGQKQALTAEEPASAPALPPAPSAEPLQAPMWLIDLAEPLSVVVGTSHLDQRALDALFANLDESLFTEALVEELAASR